VGVGFGIRDAQSARAVGQAADAVVIGSRIVQLLQEDAAAGSPMTFTGLKRFVQEIRSALDA
jgi:tryptophan synthase alpha chain